MVRTNEYTKELFFVFSPSPYRDYGKEMVKADYKNGQKKNQYREIWQ